LQFAATLSPWAGSGLLGYHEGMDM
jgi:hypothetical protein